MNVTLNRYLAGIFRRLKKIGIEITPTLLVREGLEPLPTIDIDEKFEFGQLGEHDLPGVHRLRPGMSLERYGNMLGNGKLCFGLKDSGSLVAKMWIDFEEINSVLYSRPLASNEAYLFDAFSDENYRGQNLAPYLRLRCYEVIKERGRDAIYSVTEFTNTPARKFKLKLNAQDTALIVYFNLFGRFSGSWLVRRRKLHR